LNSAWPPQGAGLYFYTLTENNVSFMALLRIASKF